MVRRVQPNPPPMPPQVAPVQRMRAPRGIGADPGSVSSSAEKKRGIFERGVRWVCFFLVKVFWKIAGWFGYARPEEPAPPEPELREDEEDPLQELREIGFNIAEYFHYIQNAEFPPNDPHVYYIFERLVGAYAKKEIYEELGRGIRMSLWQWMTCWTEKQVERRNVMEGKELAKRTPSVLVNYIKRPLGNYLNAHP